MNITKGGLKYTSTTYSREAVSVFWKSLSFHILIGENWF